MNLPLILKFNELIAENYFELQTYDCDRTPERSCSTWAELPAELWDITISPFSWAGELWDVLTGVWALSLTHDQPSVELNLPGNLSGTTSLLPECHGVSVSIKDKDIA